MNNKRIISFLMLFGLSISLAFAQISSPKPSPEMKFTQTVGLTDISVSYSRPGLKGRAVFGGLVPYGQVWRTGANHCTVIEFSELITINDNAIKPGKYGLFTIPGKDEWTVIISAQNDLWGSSGYDKSKDVYRFKVKPTTVPHTIETFTIDFGAFTDEGATLSIMWENTLVEVPVTVDTDAVIEAQIESFLEGSNTNMDAGSYQSAALFYQKRGEDLDQALEWMDKSIEMRPDAFFYIYRKALLLQQMGKKKEAIKAAKKSLEMAKANKDGDFGYAARNEALIKELEGK